MMVHTKIAWCLFVLFSTWLVVLGAGGADSETDCGGSADGRSKMFATLMSENGEMVLPASVGHVDGFELKNIKGLRKVVVEAGVSIEADAFCECTSIVEVVIRGDQKVLPERTFARCRSLVRVDLPKSLEVIRRGAFGECESLERIELPSNVRHVDVGCVRGCRNLRAFSVAEDNPHMKSVGGIVYSRDGSDLLLTPTVFVHETLDIPEGVRKISSETFRCTRGLKKLSLPSTLDEIGFLCFHGGSDIEWFEVVSRNPVFVSCSGLLYSDRGRVLLRCPPARRDEITLAPGVEEIGFDALGNSGATKLILPDSVKRFPERWAFCRCHKLQEVVMPDAIEDIGFDIFSNCPQLKTICLSKCGGSLSFTNGFLSDTARNELLYCVPLSGEGEIRLPNGITKVRHGAFGDLRGAFCLVLPSGIEHVSMPDLFENRSIVDIKFEGDVPKWFSFFPPNHRLDLHVDFSYPRWRAYAELIKEAGVSNIVVHAL